MISKLSLQHNQPPRQTPQTPVVLSTGNGGLNMATAAGYHSLSPTQGDQLSESTSSSSLSNTDSDSLRSSSQQNVLTITNNNNNNHDNHTASKSPILIKYNYYDHNGARQEQANHDMNYQQQQQQVSNRVTARNLSPTFKQSLDQIVRNSQQQLQQLQTNKLAPTNLSPPSSPEVHLQQQQQQQLQQIHLARRYKMSLYEQRCLRCNKTVYQMDKVGPLKDFTFYHQNCFKCRECGTKLTLKTYFNNQQSSHDHEVYCHRHCPKTGPGKLDNQSVGIRAALNAPKVFDATCHHEQLASGVVAVNGHLSPHLSSAHHHHHHHQQFADGPQVDSSALYIQHAVQQTRLQNIYKQSQVDKKISQFINRRLEFLEPKQKMLEMRHREEEDALFKTFEAKWRQEESCISEQIRQEWQVELAKLLDKYKRQLSNISTGGAGATHQQQQQQVSTSHAARNSQQVAQLNNNSNSNNNKSTAAEVATVAETKRLKNLLLKQLSSGDEGGADSTSNELSKQQMIEFERMNLEKTMTIKLDRKKETLKRKLKEFERAATAELVEKQSREMLSLISMKLDEYKEEQKRKIGSDLEQFEAMESLANQLGTSLQLAGNGAEPNNAAIRVTKQHLNGSNNKSTTQLAPVTCDQLLSSRALITSPGNLHSATRGAALHLEAPPPKPPQMSKMELYNNLDPDEVFRDIDQLAINVAREDQRTFTDLVHHLTRHCLTDVEKARAIFRWITVKNLNTMHFDSSVKPDTPLGLLRGIKNGSESYHVLFKRLCSYAGLHCVVIKGYSKSAGYQPGVKFEGNRFRNSWNAVYVAGAWRFVQCNWGARHLVSVAVMQDKSNAKGNLDVAAKRELPAASPVHLIPAVPQAVNSGRSQQHHHHHHRLTSPNHGRRGLVTAPDAISTATQFDAAANHLANNHLHQPSLHQQHRSHHSHHLHQHQHHHHGYSNHETQLLNPAATKYPSPGRKSSASSASSSSTSSSRQTSPANTCAGVLLPSPPAPVILQQQQVTGAKTSSAAAATATNDSLRYEYDDHYFLTDPDEFIYEFYPLTSDWQLIKTRPITLNEFEQLPFVRSLFFKYGLYFPQSDIRSVLHTDSSGATTIKIGMPTHMIPSLIFHYNLKYYHSDVEHYEGVSLKRFVMQSVESGTSDSSNGGQVLLSNIVTFRVHLPENGSYILDIFANSTTPTQYITGEPMKFKSVCKFKIIAKNLKTCMVPLPDCASGEYGPMKATRLFGIIPITHESGLISVQNDKRFLEIQFRMTRPLLDFMASLHKNGYDEHQLSKSIKIFIEGDIVFVTVKFPEDGQYGLDVYTRDHQLANPIAAATGTGIGTAGAHQANQSNSNNKSPSSTNELPKKQLLTHCCKYLINVRSNSNININNNNNSTNNAIRLQQLQ